MGDQESVRLGDLKLESCDASEEWQRNLADLMLRDEDVFS